MEKVCVIVCLLAWCCATLPMYLYAFQRWWNVVCDKPHVSRKFVFCRCFALSWMIFLFFWCCLFCFVFVFVYFALLWSVSKVLARINEKNGSNWLNVCFRLHMHPLTRRCDYASAPRALVSGGGRDVTTVCGATDSGTKDAMILSFTDLFCPLRFCFLFFPVQ